MEIKFLTANQVRARFGDISDMTLWRWLRDPALGFPPPLIINRRRFFQLDQIENFEANRASSRDTAQMIDRSASSDVTGTQVAITPSHRGAL